MQQVCFDEIEFKEIFLTIKQTSPANGILENLARESNET